MADDVVNGMDRLLGKLAALGPAIDKQLQANLLLSGLKVEEYAKKSITEGGKTGKVYVRGKNRTIRHRASAPGQAPANDTGRLVNSIATKATAADTVQVSAGSGLVNYAASLEFGTAKMAARPFMAPALMKAKPEIEALVGKAVVDATAQVTKR